MLFFFGWRCAAVRAAPWFVSGSCRDDKLHFLSPTSSLAETVRSYPVSSGAYTYTWIVPLGIAFEREKKNVFLSLFFTFLIWIVSVHHRPNQSKHERKKTNCWNRWSGAFFWCSNIHGTMTASMRYDNFYSTGGLSICPKRSAAGWGKCLGQIDLTDHDLDHVVPHLLLWEGWAGRAYSSTECQPSNTRATFSRWCTTAACGRVPSVDTSHSSRIVQDRE